MNTDQNAGSDLSFEASEEEILEPEEVVQKDSDSDEEWEDCDDEMEDESKPQKQKKVEPQVWDDKTTPLQEDEELEYDGSAYEMLHRCKVEWPCLSIDFLLRERSNLDGPSNPKTWFPS